MVIIQEFGRVSDFVRSSVVEKVTTYFSSSNVRDLVKEFPVVEKYEITEQDSEGKFQSSVSIQRYFSDLFQKLPLIAITTTGEKNVPLNLFDSIVVDSYAGILVSSLDEPYNLDDRDNLSVLIDGSRYDIIFNAEAFSDIHSILIDDLNMFFRQILPELIAYRFGSKLALADFYGREVIVIGGTALEKLGFVSGQGYVSIKRTSSLIAEEMDVQIDVVASDRNQRTELSDVIHTFFGFYLYDKEFGQWVWDNGFIIFKNNFVRRGESEASLQDAPVSKLYFDSLSVTVFASISIEREKDIENLTLLEEGILL